MTSIDAFLEWLDREIDDAERQLRLMQSAFATLATDDDRCGRGDVVRLMWPAPRWATLAPDAA